MSDCSSSWSPGLHISGGILVHSSLQILSKSLRLCFQWEGMRFTPNIPRYMAPSIVPSMRWSHPVPLAEKQPQSIMFPPPCLTVGMVFLGSYSAFFPLYMRQVELMPKSSILVSSDHKTFSKSFLESFKCSLANFRCASLSRGTLRVLQDFKPLRRSVLPIVFLVTVVPAALRSFTSSPCVVLGLFCPFRMITDTARGDILHGAPDLERWTVVWCCFHLRII